MEARDDDDCVVSEAVEEQAGKATEVRSPRLAVNLGKLVWVVDQAIEDLLDCLQELVAESGATVFIPWEGFLEVGFSILANIELHLCRSRIR